MNHQKHYDALILKARSRESVDGYTERHHAIPRKMGGTNAAENIVVLTAREHFVAHMLLAFIHGAGMWHAANMMRMARPGCGRYLNARLYEIARRNHATSMKLVLSGRKMTPENVEKNRLSQLGKKRSPAASEKARQKMLGRKNSRTTIELMSASARRAWADGRLAQEMSDRKRRFYSDDANRARVHSALTIRCLESGVEFVSATRAAEWLREGGFTKAVGQSMLKAARGELAHAHGLHWALG